MHVCAIMNSHRLEDMNEVEWPQKFLRSVVAHRCSLRHRTSRSKCFICISRHSRNHRTNGVGMYACPSAGIPIHMFRTTLACAGQKKWKNVAKTSAFGNEKYPCHAGGKESTLICKARVSSFPQINYYISNSKSVCPW